MSIKEKINEFRKIENKSDKTHWSDIKINLPNGKSFKVNGFGICEKYNNIENNFNKGSFRYYLEFNIENKKQGETLTVLLMNPSDKTKPKKNIDNTIKNALKIGFVGNYAKVIILNSFSKIYGNSNEAKNYIKNLEQNNTDIKYEKINNKFVEEEIKNSNEILIACGSKLSEDLYQKYLSSLKDFNKKIWTYSDNFTKKENRPRHLSIQSKENRERFYSFLNKPKKYLLELIKDNGTLSLKFIK